MTELVIQQLSEYGEQAGEALVRNFDMDHHRLLRARAILGPLEGALDEFASVYDADYHALLAEKGDPASKRQSREVFAAFADDLKAIGNKARALHESDGTKSIRQGKIITTDAEVRLVATDDRVPASARDGVSQ